MAMRRHAPTWIVLALVTFVGVGCGLFDPDAGERDRIQAEAESFLEELDLGEAFVKGEIHSIPATTPQERFGPSGGSVSMSFTSTDALTAAEFRDRILPVLGDSGLELVDTPSLSGPVCNVDRISIEWFSPQVGLGGSIIFLPIDRTGVVRFLVFHRPTPLIEGEDVEFLTESDIVCPGDSP